MAFPLSHEKVGIHPIYGTLVIKIHIFALDNVKEGVLTTYCHGINRLLQKYAMADIIAANDSKYALYLQQLSIRQLETENGF